MCGRDQSKMHLPLNPFCGGTVGGQRAYRPELSLNIKERPVHRKELRIQNDPVNDDNLQQDCGWLVH